MSYFKVLPGDNISKSIIKAFLVFILAIVASVCYVGANLLNEKNTLSKNYEKLKNKGSQYSISKPSLLYDGKIKELDVNDYSLNNYERSVLSDGYKAVVAPVDLTIYLFSFTSSGDILHEERRCSSVKYKKDRYFIGKEEYYDPGSFTSNAYGYQSYKPGGLKQKATLMERQRENPIYALNSCANYFRKKEFESYRDLGEDFDFRKDMIEKINGDNKYYQMDHDIFKNKTNTFSGKFTTDNFDIDVNQSTSLYTATFSKWQIKHDILYFSFLIFAIPFYYYSRGILKVLGVKKLPIGRRILHIWLCSQFAILVLSYSEQTFFNKYGRYQESKFWPIIDYADYQNKFIPTRVLGPEMGYGTEGYTSNEKEMIAFFGIFNNYDYTEFLTYSLIGIIIFVVSRKKDKRTKNWKMQEQTIDTVTS